MLPGLFINNAWSSGPNKRECASPVTGTVFAHVATADVTNVETAVQAARVALRTWGTHEAGSVRAKALYLLADRVEAAREELVKAIQLDNGKPGFEAELEVTQTANCFRFFAG